MRNLNIDILDYTNNHYNYLSILCDSFSFNNVIKGKICFKADSGTSVTSCLLIGQEVS